MGISDIYQAYLRHLGQIPGPRQMSDIYQANIREIIGMYKAHLIHTSGRYIKGTYLARLRDISIISEADHKHI